MGLAAFNRMRRMAKEKNAMVVVQPVIELEKPIDELTVKQLKTLLEEKDISYRSGAKKQELLDLLAEAETEELEEDNKLNDKDAE